MRIFFFTPAAAAASALLVLLLPATTHAFPRFIVNSCNRNLQVGQVIMGLPVAPSTDADPAQQHTIDVLNRNGTSVCNNNDSNDSPVVQPGDRLTLRLDDALVQGSAAQYIVEATSSFLLNVGTNDVGCDQSRVVNVDTPIHAVPLQNDGSVTTVRLLSAYGFGQVYASPECDVTVAASSRTFVTRAGYLVDNGRLGTAAASQPYTLTADQLLSGSSQGYSLVVLDNDDDDGSITAQYTISDNDDDDVAQIVTYLNTLSATATDIQVSLRAFETSTTDDENGTLERIVTIEACADAATCEGFYAIPGEEPSAAPSADATVAEVCFQDGFCIESSVIDEDAGTITLTVSNDDGAWFSVGFTTNGGGMTAGGSGSDIFACSADGLLRYNPVTSQSSPATQNVATNVVVDNPGTFCDIVDGRMTFTRTLAGDREIVPGTPTPMIFARGPVGETSFLVQHPTSRRGSVTVDLEDISGGITQVKQTPEWALWCHIVLMSVAWGICLPLAVVIANRTRNNDNSIPGAKEGAWFWWHKSLAGMGWLFQTAGLCFVIYYVEDSVEGNHWNYEHSKLGLFVAIAGFLQPISALVRPHEPKEGWPDGKKSLFRIVFEIYHKGFGWTAMICGVVNIFLGAKLVRDLDFEDVVSNVPVSLGSIGCGLFAIYFVLGVVMPNNPIARAITFAKKEEANKNDPSNTAVDMGQ